MFMVVTSFRELAISICSSFSQCTLYPNLETQNYSSELTRGSTVQVASKDNFKFHLIDTLFVITISYNSKEAKMSI